MPDYLEAHRKIKNAIERKAEERDCGCVSVKNIANELRMDTRTVRAHLELMRIDDYGEYLDDEGKLFCPIDGAEKFVNRLREKIEKKKKSPIENMMEESGFI